MQKRIGNLQRILHVLVSSLLMTNGFLPAFLPPILSPNNAALQAGTATVSVQSPADPVELGEQFTVPINISDLTAPLSGFEFSLTYDPAVIAFDGAAVDPFLSSTGRQVQCPPPAFPSTNVVRIACAGAGEMGGPAGSGGLVTLTFTALSPGTSALDLSSILLPGSGVPPATIVATAQNGTAVVVPAPGADWTPNQSQSGFPGTAVTHVFTLTNLGNYTDTFALDVSGFQWQTTPDAAATDPLAPGETQAVSVEVIIPNFLGGVTIGSDAFTLTATSGWDTDVTADVQGTTLANINPEVTLNNDLTGAGETQTVVEYTLVVTNTGNYTDTFALSVSGAAWPTDLSHDTTPALAVGESFTFDLSVTIPQGAGGTQDVAAVTAESGWDSSIADTALVTTTALESEFLAFIPVVRRAAAQNGQGGGTAVPPEPALVPPAGGTPNPLQPPDINVPSPACYATDLDCDQDIDELDLQLIGSHWNCALGDGCYTAAYDFDTNNIINVVDLAWVGNDYDVTPPLLTITNPANNGVVGTEVQVTGVVTDTHPVSAVTVNGIPANLVGSSFSADITLGEGNQTIQVTAEDAVGATSIKTLVVGADTEGPAVTIHEPRDRQSVYTQQPFIDLTYNDFYQAVDSASVEVQIVDESSTVMTVTNDLTVTDTGAQGTLSSPLPDDASYLLRAFVSDVAGNETVSEISFYIPLDPTTITPPVEPDAAGWVSGVVYDSANCDVHLTQCQGLAGVEVTLERVDVAALQQVRQERAQQVEQQWLQNSTVPQPMQESERALFTEAVSGTIVTGPDGFFAFPVANTGVYWLRAEKEGFSYGQREAEIVSSRSTAMNDIYLTPLDTAVTTCDETGCVHNNTEGSIQLIVPPGAIPAGETRDVSATRFEQVEFLPSGELPPGTWETYAFNLGGASEVTFTQPITVRQQNELGFAPGTQIPLGYWNQTLQMWEHAGTGVVDATGQWVEMQVTHFSNYDCNDPLAPPSDTDADGDDQSDDDENEDPEGECGCFVDLKTGRLEEELALSPINVAGGATAPALIYNSSRVEPNEVIDVGLSLNLGPGAELGDHIGFELFIQGAATDAFTFDADLEQGEVGRYRYLWDGRDGQGNLLSPGAYDYQIKFTIPYTSQYCYALNGIFGNPPDCVNGATGVFVVGTEEIWVNGTVELDTQVESPYGAGWVVADQQRLYEDEAGNIIIADGRRVDEFYFAGKDLLFNEQQTLQSMAGWNGFGQGTPVINLEGHFSPAADGEAVPAESPADNDLVPESPPWTNIANYPVAMMDAAAVEYNGLIYSFGGRGTAAGSYNTAYVYNPGNNTWTQLANMNFNHQKPGVVVLGDKIYVAGGWDNSIATANLEIYDPATNTWTVAAPMPIGRSSAPAVVVGGQFYVIGGCIDNDCTPSNNVYRYDPALDNWEVVAPYPEIIAWQACGNINGLIFCAGGVANNSTGSARSYMYNPATNTWTAVADLPQTMWGSYYGVADDHLYVVAGVTNNFSTVTNTGFYYDPVTDTWTQIENANFARYRGASACGFYKIGGSSSSFNAAPQSEVYPDLTNCGTEPAIYSRTATDYSTLEYDPVTETYTRTLIDGRLIHFNPDGTHDFTLSPDGRRLTYDYNPDGSIAAINIFAPGETAADWSWIFAYSGGRLDAITDPAGRVTDFTVNANGNLVSMEMPDGSTRQMAYDSRHLPTHFTDQNGHVTTHMYDEYGRVVEIIEPPRAVYDYDTGTTTIFQETRTFTHSDTDYALINDSIVGDPDNPAPPVPTSDQLIDVVTYGRGERSGITNQWGSWANVTDGEGRTTVFEHDGRNNLLRVDLPDGDCVEYSYDGRGNRVSEDHGDATQCAGVQTFGGQLQSWDYLYETEFNRIKSITDPNGNVTTYVYDYEVGSGTAGLLVQEIYPAVQDEVGNTVTPTVSYTYNDFGLLASVTDERGIVTEFVYTQGTPDEASNGSNPLFAPGVDPVPGLLTQIIENAGGGSHLNLTTIYREFDALGNAQEIVEPRGAVVQYLYDAMGRVVQEINELGFVISYAYDGRGNLIQQIDGDTTGGRQRLTTYTYDANDQLLTKTTFEDGIAYEIVNTYDINRQLALVGDNQGRANINLYDDANQLIGVTDPLSQTSTYSYTVNGELDGQTFPDGRTVSFAYDGRGNLTAITPPGRPQHEFTYTALDEVESYTPPDIGIGNTSTTYQYNALQQPVLETRPDGRQIEITYDAFQRTHSISFSRGDLTYGYSPDTSQLVSITAPGGIGLAYGYDDEALTGMTWSGPVAGSVEMVYDDYYRLVEERVNGSSPITFSYSDDNLLTQIGSMSLSRLPATGLISGATLDTLSDSWDYNPFGELAGYNASSSAGDLFDVSYSYDELGRIESLDETINGDSYEYEFEYDASGRLVTVREGGIVIQSYGYDDNGNRISFTDSGGTVTGTYDAQDRLLEYGNTTYGYLAGGELISKTTGVNTTFYDYDEFSNLMGVTLPGGTSITYLVDGENRRIGKEVNGTPVQGFLYRDALNPIAELDGSGNVVSRFIYGTRHSVPDYMIRGGVTYRIVADHLGSVRLVVNAATGAVVQQMNYDAFGRVTLDTNPGFQPFGFGGGLYDDDTGLVRFGARDYDAEIGRWTTKDPILFNGKSTNLYVYSLNDPVNNTDSSGYILDTLVDIGFILYDLYRIGRDNIFGDCDNLGENLAALGADALGAAIPFATGGGVAVRAGARYGDDAFDAGRGLWRDANGRLRDASGRYAPDPHRPPSPRSHGPEFERAKADFKQQSLDDPNTPAHIRGWLEQEARQRGSNPRNWRNPPGYDVGHRTPGIDSPDNFRWERSTDNRSRGGRFGR